MKIAIDISQIAYEGTGVAHYVRQLVTHLISIDKKNDYILFGISLRKQDFIKKFFESFKKYQNVKFKLLPLPQTLGRYLWNKLHLINIEKFTGEIDILHTSDWIEPSSKAKKVTTIHDLIIFKYPEYSHPDIIAIQKEKIRWVKRETDMIIADSSATKEDIIKLLHFDHKKIEVIYPGIDAIFKPIDEIEVAKIRQKYGLYNDYILSVGTLEPRKNIKGVLTAFEKFLKHQLIIARKKPVELIIAGKPGWGENVKKTKFVRFLGYIENKDLPALYAGAQVFVYPSLYEGFGFPVLEAMACGCPVVSSNRGSLAEIINGSALVIDPEMPDDISVKMTQLVIDTDLREKLIKKGKENVSRFQWEKTAKQVLAIYEKLL